MTTLHELINNNYHNIIFGIRILIALLCLFLTFIAVLGEVDIGLVSATIVITLVILILTE